jgi:hypothetical protein
VGDPAGHLAHRAQPLLLQDLLLGGLDLGQRLLEPPPALRVPRGVGADAPRHQAAGAQPQRQQRVGGIPAVAERGAQGEDDEVEAGEPEQEAAGPRGVAGRGVARADERSKGREQPLHGGALPSKPDARPEPRPTPRRLRRSGRPPPTQVDGFRSRL